MKGKTFLFTLVVAVVLILFNFPAHTTVVYAPPSAAIGAPATTTLYLFGTIVLQQALHDGIPDATLQIEAYVINFAVAFLLVTMLAPMLGGKK